MILGSKTEGGILAPLNIETNTICEASAALSNVMEALKLPHPLLKWHKAHDGVISICGAGPSLKRTYGDLQGHVMACNSALGWLSVHGVNADSAMLWDADPRVAKFVTRVPGCRYYVASRCDPAVFNQLTDMDVMTWHASGDAGLLDRLEESVTNPSQFSPCVNGGSAAVTRAIYLAMTLGYRDIHLHGADSSFEGAVSKDSHVGGSIVDEQELSVRCGKKWFQTTPWMAAQAQEFVPIYEQITLFGGTITVHGDGLIPHIWQLLTQDKEKIAC